MRRTRSQIRAAQIAELAAEQAAHDARVKDAVKFAAFARCDAVEQLYELLDVRPERPTKRKGRNGPYEVATDKEEVIRTARLIDAVTRLVSPADAHGSAAPPDTVPVPETPAERLEVADGPRFTPAPGTQLGRPQPVN